MPPDIALQAIRSGSWRSRLPAAWRRPLAHLALSWIALMVLTASAWSEMAAVTTTTSCSSRPSSHGLSGCDGQSLPGCSWLVARPRARRAALFVWLELAGVNIVAQAGRWALPDVLAILGPRVTAGLLFPLAYMVFLVPFGDELVPALQMITADVVIWLTRISGIAAVIDGVFIDTPAGLFEVAEACSGVKFLIAMIALGVLVAQTCFERWGRRLAFIATCIAVPIIANGVRARGTIYIAQSQGIEFAAGSLFYGWIFFAIVVAVILGRRGASSTAIRGAGDRRQALAEAFSGFTAQGRSIILAIAAIILIFAAWNVLASRLEADLPDRLVAPQVDGWTQETPSMQLDWEPRASGADLRLLTSYVDREGRRVDLFAAAYATQGPGRDPAAYGEGALVPDTDWRWLRSGESRPDATSDYLFALGSVKRLAQTAGASGT